MSKRRETITTLDAQYVCSFSNRHDLDTPLRSDEFASMPFTKSPEDAVARGCVTTEATAPRIASHGG